jgi:hypothetical protein
MSLRTRVAIAVGVVVFDALAIVAAGLSGGRREPTRAG